MGKLKHDIGILKQQPLFRGLTEEEIRTMLEQTGARQLSKEAGSYILRAGDHTDSMGFVLSGSVLIIQEDVWGHRNILSKLPPAGVFAEIFASIPGSVLNVSVVAETDSEILFLNVKRLLSQNSAGNPCYDRMIRNLVTVLAQKTLAFNEKITHISRRTTREKLLSYLSAEAIRQGSLSFDITFNRQQLADYLCVERAAMSVELSRLQKENLLHYQKNHFELQEISGL